MLFINDFQRFQEPCHAPYDVVQETTIMDRKFFEQTLTFENTDFSCYVIGVGRGFGTCRVVVRIRIPTNLIGNGWMDTLHFETPDLLRCEVNNTTNRFGFQMFGCPKEVSFEFRMTNLKMTFVPGALYDFDHVSQVCLHRAFANQLKQDIVYFERTLDDDRERFIMFSK